MKLTSRFFIAAKAAPFACSACVFSGASQRPGIALCAALFALLSFAACTDKTRTRLTKSHRFKHRFQQGTADDLYNRSDILGKNPIFRNGKHPPLSSRDKSLNKEKFPPLDLKGGYPQNILTEQGLRSLLKIRTAKKGEKAAISFAQENIFIDPAISFVNQYEFLDYKIMNARRSAWHRHIARLLGKVRTFKGFPETDYYILPVLIGNRLILYKAGAPDKIPYDELPLARQAGGLLAVPLAGYPVEYCAAEVIPDINDRKTGQYRPRCEGVRMEYAKYIRLKEGEKQIFKYESKPDLFPRDFFNSQENEGGHDQWFYVRTVVKSPHHKLDGFHPFVPSNLVEFHPASGKLDVLDAGSYDLKQEDKIRAVFLPVEWTDYQIKRDSENLHSDFKEEKKEHVYDRELRYFKIKFQDLVNNSIEYGGKKTLKSVIVTDDYFSFNVEITAQNSDVYLVKFAFLKKQPAPSIAAYAPKRWFEEDSVLFFPSFSEKRRYYQRATDHSEEDHDRFLRVTRFNPEIKEIRYVFSKQTPAPDDLENQWVRETGRLAIDLINSALREAGKGSKIKLKAVLDESETAEVGDIRHNILNLVVSKGKERGGLLGLGPNTANPLTGEVVSATANVWVNRMLGLYINAVRQYIRFHIYPSSYKMEPFSKEMSASLRKRIEKKAPECQGLPLKPLGLPVFLYEKIGSVCQEVSDFIEKHKGLVYDPENPDLQDKEAIKSCARKLAFLPVLGVTLHEILHGFGQRHVLSASVDVHNFYKSREEMQKIFGNAVERKAKELFGIDNLTEGTSCHPHPPQYSSVMDYMDFSNPMLWLPGKLDIAALRFLYFDKVERVKMKDGAPVHDGFLNVQASVDSNKPQRSILQTAAAEGLSKENLRSYNTLCGGDKIEGGSYQETDDNQPLCAIFDYGADPFEIVLNGVLQTHAYLTAGRSRYDSESLPYLSSEGDQFKTQAGGLYKKWKQKRDEALKEKSALIEDWSFMNPEHVREYKDIIEAKRSKSPEFKLYYDIRRTIFEYFKRLVFMPAKHCVYRTSDGAGFHTAFALENIIAEEKGDYRTYPENSKARLINCRSPVALNWADENQKGDLAAEAGFFAESRKYFLRKTPPHIDDESSAFKVWDNIMDSSFSDMLREPDLGASYYREVRAYMLEGADLNPYISEPPPAEGAPPAGRIHLERILTARADKLISKDLSGVNQEKSAFTRRWSLVQEVVDKRKAGRLTEGLHFDYKAVRLIDLGRAAQSVESGGDYPFFAQIRKEYEDSLREAEREEARAAAAAFLKRHDLRFIHRDAWEEERAAREARRAAAPDSFAAFIKDHPATLFDEADGGIVFVPYKDSEENLPSRLFRRFNEFQNCIANHEKESCREREEKRAWTETLLKYYSEERKKEFSKNDGPVNGYR